MKNLQMPLKKKWFEMTKSGEKPEDYRSVTPYWERRLLEFDIADPEIGEALCALRDGYTEESVNEIYGVRFKQFTHNVMTLGYPSSTDTDRILRFEHAGIEIRTGNPDWGAEPGKIYFVIKHGNNAEQHD